MQRLAFTRGFWNTQNASKALEPQVADVLKLVLRVYIQKPRTTIGWTGPVNQPDPFAAPDIAEGAYYTRKMMAEVAEMVSLWPMKRCSHTMPRVLLNFILVAIGARSTEDQEHRIFCSSIEPRRGHEKPNQRIHFNWSE